MALSEELCFGDGPCSVEEDFWDLSRLVQNPDASRQPPASYSSSPRLNIPRTPSFPPTPAALTPAAGTDHFGQYARRMMAGDYARDVCWACDTGPVLVQHCHVIAKSDLQALKWQQAHLFPQNLNRGDLANGVILCPNCHSQYDFAIDPGFVFFPEDLQYFIDFEIADKQKRDATGSA